jgi:hypothetical protein
VLEVVDFLYKEIGEINSALISDTASPYHIHLESDSTYNVTLNGSTI